MYQISSIMKVEEASKVLSTIELIEYQSNTIAKVKNKEKNNNKNDFLLISAIQMIFSTWTYLQDKRCLLFDEFNYDSQV